MGSPESGVFMAQINAELQRRAATSQFSLARGVIEDVLVKIPDVHDIPQDISGYSSACTEIQ